MAIVRAGILAVLAALAVGSSATAATPDVDTFARIDRFVAEQNDARRVPGSALAIVSDGRVVHTRGFGDSGRGTAVSARTPFVLGSTSKSITALAVMQLVDQGAVALDDPIARFVPELRLAGGAEQRITVRHLVNQTSGIPGSAGGRLLRSVGDGSTADVLNELRGTALAATPGERFEYANANYVLLGVVIERASGEPYGAYVERHIFAPLGMRDSTASSEVATSAGLARGHRYWFGFPVGHGPTSPTGIRPAGYLMSSAADMARYLVMFQNGGVLDGRRIVSQAGIATLLTPVAEATMGAWSGHHTSRYAMGWYVGGPWSEQVVLHPGGSPDSSSMIVLIPERRLAVVTLANANTEMPLPGADGSLDLIPSGVVSLLVGEEPAEGVSLTRFYLVFDAVVALMLAAGMWSLVRLIRRRHVGRTDRRHWLQTGRGALEVGAGGLLLLGPPAIWNGWSAAMLWVPDLTLAVIAIGGLLVAAGALRIGFRAVEWRSRRRSAQPTPPPEPPPHDRAKSDDREKELIEVSRLHTYDRPGDRSDGADAGWRRRFVSWARRHPLRAYVMLAYAISWTLWMPGVLGLGGVGGTIALGAGGFGPAVAAALVIHWSGRSVREWLRSLLVWRVPIRYYVYAIGLPIALFGIMNVELAALGEEVHLDRIGSAAVSFLGTFAVVAFVGGGQEEPGWRGFALDKFQATHTPIKATLLLGLVWGVWHLPLYGLAFIGPMMFVFFYTWLYNRTGSVLLCVLLHASFTPALDHVILVDDSGVVDAVILGTMVAGALALIAATRGRLGIDHRPASAPPLELPQRAPLRPGPVVHT